MAALWIDAAGAEAGQDPGLSIPSLREWLSGDWGLLFSHPDDFQDGGLENDRWLEILRDEFRGRGVRPLACARNHSNPDRSWVSSLLNDGRLISLQERGSVRPADAYGRAANADTAVQAGFSDGSGILDLPARTLRRDILGLRERFVFIIDGALRQCGLFKYLPARLRISPLDLLSSVDALRRRHAGTRQAA